MGAHDKRTPEAVAQSSQRLLWAVAVLIALIVPQSALAYSVSLNDPPDNTVVVSPQGGGVPSEFSATRDMTGCQIAPSYQSFYIDIEFPGESQYYPVATNLGDETTISGGTLLYPGVYHWKATLYCDPNQENPVESEVRTYTIIDGSIPPHVTFSEPAEQHVNHFVRISYTCDAACSVDLTGALKIPHHKPYDIKKRSFAEVPAGAETDQKVALSKRAVKAAKVATDAGETPKASLKLTFSNSVGTSTTQSQTITLTP
jgi:hypothetical protein